MLLMDLAVPTKYIELPNEFSCIIHIDKTDVNLSESCACCSA